MLRLKPKGRLPSLLAWGLLVGGVALLMTFPDGAPAEGAGLRQVPAAILFALAGFVFGLSHPEGRAWTAAVLLGWIPLIVGAVVAVEGDAHPVLLWLGLMLTPAALAGLGGWAGALTARRRSRPGL
jgi:hypothetical protein